MTCYTKFRMGKKLKPLEIIAKSEIILVGNPSILFVRELESPEKQYGGHYIIGPGDDKEIFCHFFRDNNMEYHVRSLRPSVEKGDGVTEVVMSNYAIFEIHKKRDTLPNKMYDSVPFDNYQKLRPLKPL